MSKSDPDSAIFMEDSVKDVERKIKLGFCPEKIVAGNPIMDYARYIIFPAFENKIEIQIRKENEYIERTYTSIDEFEKDYISGEIHPGDLKPAVAKAINKLLQPVRDHFANNPYARNLLETIKRWQAELSSTK